MSTQAFAAQLRVAENRLRAVGLNGRSAFAALCRHLAARLHLPKSLWIEGIDAPASAGLDLLDLTADVDLFGLAYERFFPEVFKGERGQFFTPRPLVEMMTELAGLQAGDRVLDPTCGSGGFLVVAHGLGATVSGIELDPELVALCRLNLQLHGADPRAVRRADLFRDPVHEQWDLILANPPFSLPIRDPESLKAFELSRTQDSALSDVIFVEAAHARLRPGGRLCMVLPHSVLANDRFERLRQWMDERFVRRAIVALPEGVFRPFGGAAGRACVICLQKRPARVKDWISTSIECPGYDTKRKQYRPVEPDELSMLRVALRDGTAPRVSAEECTWNPDALSLNSGMGEGVTRTRLGHFVRWEPSLFRPSAEPEKEFTEVDLADVDKATGEVLRSRTRKGKEVKGRKTSFEQGDILFARMRPQLNNVVIVRSLGGKTPRFWMGSSEWVRLVPEREPHFALLAARSSFVRAQLKATHGQTRPRVQPSDLPEVEVPDPGAELRALLEVQLAAAHQIRARERQKIHRLTELYEAFGRGELSREAFKAALDSDGSIPEESAD